MIRVNAWRELARRSAEFQRVDEAERAVMRQINDLEDQLIASAPAALRQKITDADAAVAAAARVMQEKQEAEHEASRKLRADPSSSGDLGEQWERAAAAAKDAHEKFERALHDRSKAQEEALEGGDAVLLRLYDALCDADHALEVMWADAWDALQQWIEQNPQLLE
jgi:hypothetical protein